jgi:glucans biosynthesis protein C
MRRYELDWLRVLVFGLLIFYHVGMFFVPWSFHIKNNEVVEALTWPMIWLNQWRLPILFVISGMGTWYAFGQRSPGGFAWERVKRLFIPLVVGMLVVVPPQVYVERLAHGQFSGGYFSFWPSQLFTGPYPVGNFSWHHLWFLPYLLTYSLLLIPVFTYVRRHPESRWVSRMQKLLSRPAAFWPFVLLHYPVYSILRHFHPVTHDFTHDWFTHVQYFLFFLFGFLLLSGGQGFWDHVHKWRKHNLIGGVVAFALYLALHELLEHTVAMHFIRNFVKVLNIWLWIFAIFGWATVWLNKGGNRLKYANEAVYPFYILHQTVMLVLGYYLMDLPWSVATKFTLMVVGTFGISWCMYEVVIRRFGILKPLFGMKAGK